MIQYGNSEHVGADENHRTFIFTCQEKAHKKKAFKEIFSEVNGREAVELICLWAFSGYSSHFLSLQFALRYYFYFLLFFFKLQLL